MKIFQIIIAFQGLDQARRVRAYSVENCSKKFDDKDHWFLVLMGNFHATSIHAEAKWELLVVHNNISI